MALLSGAITMPNGSALPASKIDKFSAHEWQPRSWDWVDPLKDVEAQIIAINAGIRNPMDVAAQAGTDFADNVKKLGEAKKMAEAAGVLLTAYIPKAAAQYASADAADELANTAKK